MNPQKEIPATHAKPSNRLLVVDDDASVRQMLARVLTEEGYQVYAAANGMAAVEIATAAVPESVLLDLNMPGTNGWETFQQLVTNKPSLIVVVILLQPNQLITALNSGVAALLEKPLNFLLLLLTVSDLLAESPKERRARIEGKPADFHYIYG